MDMKKIHTAYGILLWGTLFSLISFNLVFAGVKISTDIVFVILMTLGTYDLQRETKNSHFRSAYAACWANVLCYALFFVLNLSVRGGMVLPLAEIVADHILLIWIYTQIFIGSGTLLPFAFDKMKKGADLYAILTSAITLALMIMMLVSGNLLIGLAQILIQIWTLSAIGDCRKYFLVEAAGDGEQSS